MDNFLKQLKKVRHGIVFDADKKAATRTHLTAYMRGAAALGARPKPVGIPASARLFRIGAAVLVVVLLGAGTSFAAEGALPGQPLYAVKTGVNEKIAAALIFSPSGKANLETSLAARRLAEASQLAAHDKLNIGVAAQLGTSFESFADQAEAHIKALRASGDIDAAERISASFSSMLEAHDRALGAISARRRKGRAEDAALAMRGAAAPAALSMQASTDASSTLQAQSASDDDNTGEDEAILKLSLPLKARIRAVAEDHSGVQAELTAGTTTAVQAIAHRRIAAAADAIAAARALLARAGEHISADVSARAQVELDQAVVFEAQARARAAAGEYRDALERANKAARRANEVSVLLGLQVKIGAPVPVVRPAGPANSAFPAAGNDAMDDRHGGQGEDDRQRLNLFENDHSDDGEEDGMQDEVSH